VDELKLESQNAELLKTNAELDRFVYSVSHDLRSPLTSILGLLAFIEDETLEEDTLEHAQMIRSSIERLDVFIKNILSYSQNNRTGLEVERIPVKKNIDEIISSLQLIKKPNAINIEVDIDERQPFYSDNQRFSIVMENLISNAIKYHKKEAPGRFIKVSGTIDKDQLLLRIADNGIGIAPENHIKIFDMFFRISGNITGSGIGLYIVKETVEKLHGSIVVESEPGKGTTFIIILKNLLPNFKMGSQNPGV
jgi:signal transduction histidine kinase